MASNWVVEATIAAVSRVARVLGVARWTVMRQVIDQGTPQVEDPARLGEVGALGVDEPHTCARTPPDPPRLRPGSPT